MIESIYLSNRSKSNSRPVERVCHLEAKYKTCSVGPMYKKTDFSGKAFVYILNLKDYFKMIFLSDLQRTDLIPKHN